LIKICFPNDIELPVENILEDYRIHDGGAPELFLSIRCASSEINRTVHELLNIFTLENLSSMDVYEDDIKIVTYTDYINVKSIQQRFNSNGSYIDILLGV